MKTLYLLRHAKSDWSNEQRPDLDRPLTTRGNAAAARVAEHMRENGLVPDLILCSNAVRAEQTMAALFRAIGNSPQVRIESRLYMAAPAALLKLVRETVAAVERLLLIGHNPGMQGFALDLIGRGEEEEWGALAVKYPTAGLAVITFDTANWQDVAPRQGELLSFLRPKTLG